ncbi:MAG: two-component system, chemotaxis family, sensor kinase CheA [Acidobacteriota bacterium]|jgi:two-component system chemotaxis sensor kinase CheA|nr:two-component system, chemotaxis family, sensor kinase CheA [Acidobacteriota bacterium]
MDNPYLREFLAETEDLLEVLFGDLQALRVRRAEGRARRELVGRVFRHVHTIKGSSATAELETVTTLAHEFENLLDGVRLGRVAVDDAVLDAFDSAANAISQSLKAVAHGEAQPETDALSERLRHLARQGSEERAAPALQPTLAALPDEIARSLSKHEAHRLRETLEEGAHLFIVNVNFDLATFDERFRNLSDALAEDGEIISTLPGTGCESPDQISFRVVYATKEGREDLARRASAFGELSLTELTSAKAQASKRGEQRISGEVTSESAQTTSISSLTTHVRVELSELDAIIASAHEVLVKTTNALTLSQSFNLQPAERALIEEHAASVRGRFVELEGQLIGLRMVSVAQMLERAARAGRIAARATGKEVEFETKGGEVRLDKALADAIADPLLHILRNAVDHGVESPSERKKIGKRVRGLVRLEARGEGNRVVLRVSDDGRGIDPLRITRAAAAQGIIEAGRLLTKQQALRLIFRPGFSTAISVSSVSGRGVGLDVVERAVEQTGGELRVSSEQGTGTTFEVILPTTLALLPSLVVRSSGYRYCIDASRIIETGFIAAADFERNIAAGTIDWSGSPVPLILMRKLLAQPSLDVAGVKESMPVIIVSHTHGREATDGNGIKRAAIIVDAVEGETEALVRGLGRHAARWRGISGATELRDGAIALVLDLPRLLETS